MSWRRTETGLRIDPPNEGGFAIELERLAGEWRVLFGELGMHESFRAPDEALEFIAFGLSEDCRLREVRTVPFLHRSIVERRNGSGWSMAYEVGRPRGFGGSAPRERVFQNRLIPREPA